ncbi:MAG: DNA helicase RecQ [Elusimicrobia bacterium]|nr:DNA helicase RecQ [Elusimicrobiota bacterium]
MPILTNAVSLPQELRSTIKRIWGFDELLAMQGETMAAVMAGRDSLAILPTGGGKSLCYQAPAAAGHDTSLVISPLISLMKDQVDSLDKAGVPAAYLNSTLAAKEQRQIEQAALNGKYRLLYAAPERAVQPDFMAFLKRLSLSCFIVDEAHCISHWGHDFRPEYRALKVLRREFPEAPIHAFTATATEQVRRDIVVQLELKEPAVLVGNFDRPNLTYRAIPRHNLLSQIETILARHQGESGIIYAIRRNDVEEICAGLTARGIKAMPYHAGLSTAERQAAQEAFSREDVDAIVATVAFGMGVHRSNVRYVIHAALPKSIEHYQQETGRAGRDSLPAECVLFHSGEDFFTWKFIFKKEGSTTFETDLKKLSAMNGFAGGGFCRHAYLTGYFGQPWQKAGCQACDFCLGEIRVMPESSLIAKKIISAVYRLRQSFGADHVADVLKGAQTDKVRKNRHEKISTYGLLADHSKRNIRLWIDQLLSQGLLARTGEEYPVLALTPQSSAILRGEQEVKLSYLEKPKKEARPRRAPRYSAIAADEPLFERLRTLRRTIADELGVPAYIVFGDKTLLEMAYLKPADKEALGQVWGVGERKLETFGDRFLALIRAYLADQ